MTKSDIRKSISKMYKFDKLDTAECRSGGTDSRDYLKNIFNEPELPMGCTISTT